MFSVLLTFYFILIITSVQAAKILGIVPTPSYSHQVVFYPLWKELSLRGHQLTVLTTNPITDSKYTNLTQIDLSASYKSFKTLNLNEMAETNPFRLFEKAITLNEKIIDEQLQHPEVQLLLKNETEHFDLVMTEFMYPAMIAFAERFKCPFIVMFSLDAMTSHYHSVGNPSHPITNPDFIMAFPRKLNFLQRLKSVANTLIMGYFNDFRIIRSQQQLVYKHFGNHYPDLGELSRNASMFFVNTNPILHSIRPLLPNIIQIGGGTHIMSSKPLPKDLQDRLDSNPNGFIYFSLGSNIESARLKVGTRKIILETFSELPYTVLWKFEEENLPGKPDNVIISKWLPQQDVLRHPKIKLFITQGGLHSVEEALYNYVPIIGIPFIGDQQHNIQKVVENGMGLSLNFDKLDETTFKGTILAVMNNPKYRNRIKELVELANDQPMTGLERAIWWTEYVIRHKGAQHLRSPALDLPWYQYFLLDIISFCVLVVFIVMFVLVKITKMLFRLIRRMFSSKIKTQ